MVKPKTKADWNRYVGCQGWFDNDGFLIINPLCKLHTAPHGYHCATGSPLVTVMGFQGKHVLVSGNLLHVGQVEKKHVRILEYHP